MNWRQRILADWPHDLQRAHKAQAALRQIEEGLLQLASLGHPLHVEEGYNPPPPPEWPKAMFHLFQGGKVFACQADVEEAGPDWYFSMEEARHAAGVTKQNQRGGIFSKSLPTMLMRTPEEIVAERAAEEEAERVIAAAKREAIAEQRAIHRTRANAMNGVPFEKRNARQV
jgi:hypothetical protein